MKHGTQEIHYLTKQAKLSLKVLTFLKEYVIDYSNPRVY
jgi:hypothetical protein